MAASSLPTSRNISTSYLLSFIVGGLMAAASLAGLLFPSALYPAEELRRSSVATDLVNLFIVLPALLGSIRLAQLGRLIGLLFWPGALSIVTYHYLAYAIAVTSMWQIVIYLILVLLSLWTIYGLLSSMDVESIRRKLQGHVPEQFAGAVLAGFGALFFVWRGVLALQSLIGVVVLSQPEFATAVTDVLLAPAWVIGGVFLSRRQAWGFVTGAGLLFQLSMLFIGLFVYFALQPTLAGVQFPVNDFVAVFTMSLLCFIPFGMFVRGVLSAR